MQNYLTTQIFELKNDKINLTKLASSQDKDVREWLRNKSTASYITALEEARGNCPQLEVINGVGTFGTREVAIKLAQWISTAFEVYCTEKLNELLTTGKTQIKELTRKELLLLALEAEEKAERLELESKAKDKVIEDQNVLHGSILRMKATESRTTLKALKDDIGVEINHYVGRLFKDTDSYRQKHVNAHELYRRMTGKVYLGANKSSLESKEDYLWFLKQQVSRLESDVEATF